MITMPKTYTVEFYSEEDANEFADRVEAAACGKTVNVFTHLDAGEIDAYVYNLGFIAKNIYTKYE